MVAEGREHCLADVFAVGLKVDGLAVPAKPLCQRKQSIKPLGGLAGAACEDAQRGTARGIEVHGLGGVKRAPLAGEVRAIVRINEVLASHAASLARKDALTLHRGGDEGRLADAAVLVAREHQPRKPRLQRQRGHLVAFVGRVARRIQRAQIVEQPFGTGQ